MSAVSKRPSSLSSYFGQENIKSNLSVFINSALERDSSLDHILLFGPPGLGKTSLAMVVGTEMGVKTHIISAPSIEKVSDILPLLATIEKHDILFIDEIHRLPIAVEETLYSAMEDFKVDILLESGIEKSVVTVELEPFTLIGATTRTGLISKPMKDRFAIQFQLQEYSINELSDIICHYSKQIGVDIDISSSILIAERSRSTPRIALNLYSRSRDFAISLNEYFINNETVSLCFKSMNIDDRGLTGLDLEYLQLLRKQKKPIGLKTLATILNQDVKTIEDDVEPYLLKMDLIEKTSFGRIIKEKGLF